MFRNGRDIVPGLTPKTRVAGKSKQMGLQLLNVYKTFLDFFLEIIVLKLDENK